MNAELAVVAVILLSAIVALCYALKRSSDLNCELTTKIMAQAAPYPHQAYIELQHAQMALQRGQMVQAPQQAGQAMPPLGYPEELEST